MSIETRDIRPFDGTGELEDVFKKSVPVLHFGLEPCPVAGGSPQIMVDLLPEEFINQSISLEWAPDDQAFNDLKRDITAGAKNADIKLSDLSLWVIAENAYMKHSDRVFECSLGKLETLERKVDLIDNDRARAFDCSFSGFTVTAYILLLKALTPKGLRPYRSGTWLAKSKFVIKTIHSQDGFPLTPLTKNVRETKGLPSNTVRFVDFGDHDVFEPNKDQDPPVFYVDDSILRQLNVLKTPSSAAIQIQLVLDLQVAIIRHALVSTVLAGGEKKGYERTSLVGRMVRLAAGSGATKGALEIMMEQIYTEPESVIAKLEHMSKVGESIEKMLSGDESLNEVES